MAFTSLGAAGTGTLESAGSQILGVTMTRNLTVGEIAFLYVGADSDASGSNPTSFTSVSDNSGNTWTKVREAQQRIASLNGCLGALYWSIITTQLSTSQLVNTTFSNGSPVMKVGAVRSFSVGGGNTVDYADHDSGQATNYLANTGTSGAVTTPASGNLGTPSLGRLWIGLEVTETKVTTGTADADYTHGAAVATTSGTDSNNVRLRWGFRLSTITTDTYTGQTGATSTERVVILAAFDEFAVAPSAARLPWRRFGGFPQVQPIRSAPASVRRW